MVKKIILTIIMIQIMFVPISNAFSADSIIDAGNDFLTEGKNNFTQEINGESHQIIDGDELDNAVESLYNILFTIGVALSVVIGAILGIKFMVGSVEEQAKIKETLLPYAIGCIVVFGAFGIWKIIITMGGNIFG